MDDAHPTDIAFRVPANRVDGSRAWDRVDTGPDEFAFL
jgi:hypothetical protein